MNKVELTELMQLYSAGCIKEQDLQKLRSAMEEDENFPWLELSEYQNLVALLSVTLKTKEPTLNVKNKVVYKINKLTEAKSGENNKRDTSKQENQKVSASEGKMDWGSLSPTNKKTEKPADAYNSDLKETFTQVQPPSKIIAESKVNFDGVTDETIDLDEGSSLERDPVPQRRFEKYHYSIAGLFLIAILFGGYLYFGSNSEVKTEFSNVKTEPPKIAVKEFKQDTQDTTEEIIGVVSVGEPELITENESESQKQIQEELLPTPPPELSSPTDYPPVKFVEYVPEEENISTEETKTENQKIVPPPVEEPLVEEEPAYFVAVEEMPEPIGGLKSIQARIVYPELARRAGIEGKVFVRAYVDETGSVTRAEVIKGIGLGCDEAALDAVLNTKFNPGKQRGKPIKVQVVIPISFKQ